MNVYYASMTVFQSCHIYVHRDINKLKKVLKPKHNSPWDNQCLVDNQKSPLVQDNRTNNNRLLSNNLGIAQDLEEDLIAHWPWSGSQSKYLMLLRLSWLAKLWLLTENCFDFYRKFTFAYAFLWYVVQKKPFMIFYLFCKKCFKLEAYCESLLKYLASALCKVCFIFYGILSATKISPKTWILWCWSV